jgi:flagellar motor switch/type III secretory pathway protein FliN
MAAPAVAAARNEETGIVPAKPKVGSAEAADDERWQRVMSLPCRLTVDLPLPDFKVSDFLKLRTASVIDAHWRLGHDVPLRLNGALIGWVEFEVLGTHLAVRLTELA